MKLTIATRKSLLALWQSEFVAQKLRERGCEVQLLELSTRGDEVLDRSLSAIGGKNLFIKELEIAMQQGRAQLAVHSLKDVGAQLAHDFVLAAVCEREDERDVVVLGAKCAGARSLEQLPQGAKIGTTSLRRCLQLRLLRPDLQLANLRGNLQTRLAKLAAGEYDAIVLARAGLQRLALLEGLEFFVLEQSAMISAAGQGAVAIEARNDPALLALLRSLECPRTRALVSIERDFTRVLNGGCGAPIGINASVEFAAGAGAEQATGEGQGAALVLRAIVGNAAGSKCIQMCERHPLAPSVCAAWARGEAADLGALALAGEALALKFIAAGARELIDEGTC